MIKKIILVLVTLIPTWIKAEQYKATERICLDKNWQFTQADKNEWMPAKVHGTVHQNLIDNGKLIDPFWGMNEEKVQWVGRNGNGTIRPALHEIRHLATGLPCPGPHADNSAGPCRPDAVCRPLHCPANWRASGNAAD